jgi:hypothetical protein
MLPTAVLLSSLPAELCQPLRMSMVETQVSFYSGCLTGVASLRWSFAPFLAPLLQPFSALSLMGVPSLVPAICCAIGANFKIHFFHIVSLGRKILLRGGGGFCRVVPEFAEPSC